MKAELLFIAAAALHPVDAVIGLLIEENTDRAVRLAQTARRVLQLGAGRLRFNVGGEVVDFQPQIAQRFC